MFKPTTLWSIYSMLKTNLLIKEKIDISKYRKLSVFLKQTNAGYQPNKTKSEIMNFLKKAPDNKFLMIKVNFN